MLIAVCTFIGCNKTLYIDNNFYVEKDSLRREYLLRYKGENVFPNEYINRIGYNKEWIVACTSTFQDLPSNTRYYIINKQNFINLHGEIENNGLLGPYDINKYIEVLHNLQLHEELKFTNSF